MTIVAANVTDQDVVTHPTPWRPTPPFSFTTVDVGGLWRPGDTDPRRPGQRLDSARSPAATRSIEGVVVGDYQGTGQFGGFYVQEEDADADADPATSEGIFVFTTSCPVAVGDVVRSRGNVDRVRFGHHDADSSWPSVTSVLTCATGTAAPRRDRVTLPVSQRRATGERYEGMLVTIAADADRDRDVHPRPLRRGRLSAGSRLQTRPPSPSRAPRRSAVQDLNDRSRILLDDGNSQQNIDPTLYPAGGLSASNTLRSGDTVSCVTGVLDQRFSVVPASSRSAGRLHGANPRPAITGRRRRRSEGRGAERPQLLQRRRHSVAASRPRRGADDTARARAPAGQDRRRDRGASTPTSSGLMEIENDARPNSAIERPRRRR